MIVELGKVLTYAECDELSSEILKAYNDGNLVYEDDVNHYKNSYGGITPGSWELLKRFTPIVENIIGKQLKEENPYCRIYNNGSVLKPHIDREGLDWTISLCVYNDTNINWPLYIKEETDNVVSCVMVVGQGALVNGRVLEHWRDELECEDDKKIIQIFLHWSEIK